MEKESAGRRALLIEGARRVGKTTILEEFAENEYKTAIIMNLHPHAVLDRVLWRWYQIPFRP